MKPTILLAGILLVTMAFGLAGCSGSGAPAAQISGADLRALATDHMSALSLFNGWLGVLYFNLSSGAPTSEYEFLPDGTTRLWGTNSDGSQYQWFLYPDGSGAGSIQWPDGTRFTSVSDPTVYNDDSTITRDHVIHTYPNGARLEVNITGDYSNVLVYHGTWAGTATLPSGDAAQFTIDHVDFDRDLLNLQLPDGTALTLTIPNTVIPGGYQPRFADTGDPSGPPTGTLTVPGHGDLDFWVTGTARWEQWRFEAEDGTEGMFTLNPDGSGTGQIERRGETVGALSWTAALLGRLDLLGTGVEEVTPSAAARDFRLDQWARNTALLGPAPVY